MISRLNKTHCVNMEAFSQGMQRTFVQRQFVLCVILMATVCCPILSFAQQKGSRVVEVNSNMTNAMVYVDSLYIGRASERQFSIPHSAEVLRLVPPNLDSWSMSPLVTDLRKETGDSLVLHLNFKYHYRVESVPFDAQVFLETPGERTLLGDTPLLYAIDDPIRGMLLVTKTGFEPLRLSPGEKIWNQHYVSLEPTEQEEEVTSTFWNPGDNSSRWIDYLAGGVAIASGVMAVRFKTKADRRYARYEESGDPVLRPGFERYDTYSAIALGTMQVGLGVLAIRLVIN